MMLAHSASLNIERCVGSYSQSVNRIVGRLGIGRLESILSACTVFVSNREYT